MRKTTWLVLLGVAGTAVPVRAQEGGGGGPLSVDGGLVIWTLVVFATLLYVLKRSAWPVLLAAVREREQKLERQLARSEEHTSELQSHSDLVCRLLLEKKNSLEAARSVASRVRARYSNHS